MKIKKKKFKKKPTILKKRKFKKAKNKIKRTLKKRVKNKKRVVLKKRKKTNKKNQKSKLKLKTKKKIQKTRAIVSSLLSLSDKLKTILSFNFNLDRSLQKFFQGMSNRISNLKKVWINFG